LSDGGGAIPRAAKGPEPNICIPDFIVAKASEFLTQDVSLLIVEVKVGEPDSWDSIQMGTYMEAYIDAHDDAKDLVGLLVWSSMVEIHKYDVTTGMVKVEPKKHGINSKHIRELLRRISSDNWAIPE